MTIKTIGNDLGPSRIIGDKRGRFGTTIKYLGRSGTIVTNEKISRTIGDDLERLGQPGKIRDDRGR